ncbi:MAG TPA: hypothetical protein VFI67_11780 [Sphingomicrobium sp.]|jgi:hypothetical protein|nr:hypothetical protein [Sphingomicrobium sp.]
MDAYLSNRAAASEFDGPPVLIAATSDAAISRAHRTIEAASLRVGAAIPLDQAINRIAIQPRAAAIWIEIDRDCGDELDDLLDLVVEGVGDHRYPAVVSTTADVLDAVVARVDDSAVELVVNGGEADRVAALSIAFESHRLTARAFDVASDQNAERLRMLSEEVSRIASTLARLSAGPAAPRAKAEPTPAAELPPLSVETVRNVIRARRLRARYFPEDLFADPAWDMLLDLLQAEIAQLRVPVSSLCIAAAVPATTALRWLKALVSQQLFIRRADPHDGRRVFVELAPEASHALRCYFAEVGQIAVI